ncbi:PepSY domain-containing protein [Streptomyces boninensis]|uniref:PepSY domain-containing protein n=1 Tax=Streptomyces boninensis TaxID=2039455 RepID=UPI003B227E9A
MKRKIAIASVAALLIGGGTATAVAAAGDDAGSGPAPKAATAQQADHDDDGKYDDRDDRHDDDGKYDDRDDRDDRDDDGKDDLDQDDKAEMKALQNADVSASDAAAAALKAVPGTVDSVEFDDNDGDDRGPAAWDVDILGQDGKWHSVTIDAANAKVLEKSVDYDD